MELFKISVDVKNKPKLDEEFIPILKFNKAFLSTAKTPVSVAIERADGQIARVDSFIHGDGTRDEADRYYLNRLVKTMLWMKGGYKIYVNGAEGKAFKYIKEDFEDKGVQDFDYHFMSQVFEQPFEVIATNNIPESVDKPVKVGGFTDGCRIGFDAGGSDRKVSAVVNGKSIFSEEVVWHPKTNSDPDYHYEGIVDALKTAASKMPRVDAVGVSSAGIYINNRTMRASLFIKVPESLNYKVQDIYIRAIKDTFGDVPFTVLNDGDVSAIAGMISIGEPSVLGIAMGTSEAVGYVDSKGRITGWLNELAFVPVDCAQDAMKDEWSLDIGCGVKYFSQDSVIKLAPRAGIKLNDNATPAEKLKEVQTLMANDDKAAFDVYLSIGTYLGHTLAYYYEIYTCKHVLLMGRVMSGKGGDIILEEAKRVIADEYPEIKDKIFPALPDEKFRRVGQSAAAASLPEIR